MARLLLTFLALPLLSSAFGIAPTVGGAVGGTIVKNVAGGVNTVINPNYNLPAALGGAVGAAANGIFQTLPNGLTVIDQSVVNGVCSTVNTTLNAAEGTLLTAIKAISAIPIVGGGAASMIGNSVGKIPLGANYAISEMVSASVVKLVQAVLSGNATAISVATTDMVAALAKDTTAISAGVISPLGNITGAGGVGAAVGGLLGGTGGAGIGSQTGVGQLVSGVVGIPVQVAATVLGAVGAAVSGVLGLVGNILGGLMGGGGIAFGI